VYPDEEWLIWKFERVPGSYWQDADNQRKFFKWLESELNIKDPSQWHRVTRDMIILKGGGGLLNQYKGSHIRALETLFPGDLFKIYVAKSFTYVLRHKMEDEKKQ
jgi:hypothetical protein